MKFVLKRELFQDLWTIPIEKVPEARRKKKIYEFCVQELRNRHISITKETRVKLFNGLKNFLKNFQEKEIEFTEVGKFYGVIKRRVINGG